MIASATAIRKAVKAGQEIKGYVPESVRNDLLDQTIDGSFFGHCCSTNLSQPLLNNCEPGIK